MGWLKLKEIESFDLDSPERSVVHKNIIQSKKFLKKLYIDWYNSLKQYSEYTDNGLFLELGSGGGFIKEVMPSVVTSDVIELPGVDRFFSGEKIPYGDATVDGIMMIDVFHHIPEPALFLNEASRILKPGGKLVMSEPWNCLWSRFIYRNFHHEPFEPGGDWKIINAGALSGANGALPWIFFYRDRDLFQNQFPSLKIELIKVHTPLRYLISGGLTMRQLMPSFTFSLFSMIDSVLSYFNISMFAFIVIRKI